MTLRPLRLRSFRPLVGALAVGLAVFGSAPRRDAAAQESPVVAKVGDVVITQKELGARLARVPRMQLALLGSDDAGIRRAFLEKVMIPEILFAESAKKRGLVDQPDIRARVRDGYRSALYGKLREEAAASVTDADVATFYGTNKARFEAKERIQVWRILLGSQAEAEAVLAEAKKANPERWMTLAREKSLDKATHERGGNLGFLDDTGQSSEVAVKADPLLFLAAKRVKDGEVAPNVVPEGTQFAVVWRRGSTPAVSRGLDTEASAIRQLLVRQRTESAAKEIVERLRKDLVKDVEPTLTSIVEVGKTGEVATRKRQVPVPKAPGKPRPSSVPGQGLR